MLLLSFGSLVGALASGLSILARTDEAVDEAVEEVESDPSEGQQHG